MKDRNPLGNPTLTQLSRVRGLIDKITGLERHLVSEMRGEFHMTAEERLQVFNCLRYLEEVQQKFKVKLKQEAKRF